MIHADFYLGGGCGAAPYVACGPLSQSPRRANSCRQAWQALGVSGGRSCLLSALALFWSWASAAK